MSQTHFISGMCFMVTANKLPSVAPRYIIKAKVTIFILKSPYLYHGILV